MSAAEAKPKRGLGRGLDALFGDEEKKPVAISSPAATVSTTPAATAGRRTLPVISLAPGEYQPRHRFDSEALAELTESIKTHGVLQPLLVRPVSADRYEIIAGERRWRAAQAAQLHEVPVVIQELTDSQALQIALIENLQREDLTALEEAEGYARLIEELGHSQEDLAKQLGKSRSHIANMLRLLKLPEGVKKMLQDGSLSAGHARAILSAKDPLALAKAVVQKGLSVRAVEKLMSRAEKEQKEQDEKRAPRKWAAKDVDTLALEAEMTTLLGLKVTIEAKGAGGVLNIEYKSLDQLDDVLHRLTHAPARKDIQ